jgi:hypothetical protein
MNVVLKHTHTSVYGNDIKIIFNPLNLQVNHYNTSKM